MSRSATEPQKAVWCCSKCGAIYHKDFPRCPADGAEVVMADRDPLLGCVVGNYTIEKLIGEGGMGRVYLAHHKNLPNKLYAFKVLLGDHAASIAMRARFTREAHRASQLDHPNVCKVVDFGETQHGLLYIVMDYVAGKPLVRLVGDTPMAPRRVIAIARQVCIGLAHAHEKGIVHRDLKPENILVTSGANGEFPRIVDFGLAISLDQSDARLTESGMTMGTPAFAAPEQLSGRPVDHRADLFALGMVMYEMLTGGVLPFDGHVMEVVSAKTTKDAPRMSERVPNLHVPPELEAVVTKLTARRPEQRYANAREVIAALDGVHLGAEARQETEIDLPRRRRWPLAVASLAVVGAAVAVVIAATPKRDHVAAIVRPPALPPAPVPPPAPAPPPAPTAAPDPEPEIEMPAEPPAPEQTHKPIRVAPAKHRSSHGQRAARPAIVVEQSPALPASPVAAPPAPAAVVAPPPPPPAPVELRAKLAGIDIDGSLPAGVVQRAVERTLGAIERCKPATAQGVIVHFRIGEARRALDVHATAPTPATAGCVAAALADVRTESAPDVGDVEVTVRISFVVKT